jgi:ATP-dependent RNA helicase DeaD
MTKSFIELGLNEKLSQALEKIQIIKATEIQEKVIPIALENKDIIGQSQTGTGKTFAYLLPIFQKNETKPGVQTIILAPTHELASQIKTQVELLAKNAELPVSYALIIGEVNIKRQIDKLKEKPNIIIGSSGRILELIEKKKINVKTITTIVLDEADRLLDIKNISQVKKIINLIPKEKQTILISAGISNPVMKIASELMNSPELIKTESTNTVPDNIEHAYYLTENKTKTELLRRLVNFLKPEKSLVFVQQSEDLEKLTTEVKYHGLKVGGLFGKQSKEDRKRIVDDFRKGVIQILFATDIAARGLDIKGISHVFNYNISKDSESYLHRCGRTGRQNAKGYTVSLVNNEEKNLLFKIGKELNINITKFEIASKSN